MENKEKLEIVGLDKKPKYWDDRYMDGIEKMTPRKYDAHKRIIECRSRRNIIYDNSSSRYD
ncbi:MAG: hypothetical protein ACLTLQ_14540 [[Clostridium] scindens]